MEEQTKRSLAALAKENSQGRLVVAENSGHNIQLEQPAVVIDAIRTLVERVRAK